MDHERFQFPLILGHPSGPIERFIITEEGYNGIRF